MVVFYGRQALSSRYFGRYIFLIRICYDIPNTKHSDTSRSDHVLLGKSWCRHVTFSSFRKHKLKTHKATKKHIFGPGMTAGSLLGEVDAKKINVWVPRARVPRAEVPAQHRKCGVVFCETLTSRLLWTRPTAVKTHVNDVLQASQQDNHVKLREPNAKTHKKIHFFARTEITNASIPN